MAGENVAAGCKRWGRDEDATLEAAMPARRRVTGGDYVSQEVSNSRI